MTSATGDRVRLLRVDGSIYDDIAILKAAYVFTSRAFLHLQRANDGLVEVRLRPKNPEQDPSELAGEFLNELIDQRLRRAVDVETRSARDLILTHALSKTSLLNQEFEGARPLSKP